MESSLWFTVSVEVIVWLAHVFAFTAIDLVGNALRTGEMKKTFTLTCAMDLTREQGSTYLWRCLDISILYD